MGTFNKLFSSRAGVTGLAPIYVQGYVVFINTYGGHGMPGHAQRLSTVRPRCSVSIVSRCFVPSADGTKHHDAVETEHRLIFATKASQYYRDGS